MGDFEESQQDMTLRALAFELKNPLIAIARRAELADDRACAEIQRAAQQTLMLIDSYLLTSQLEYGQMALDLAPVSVGSVLYDLSVQMREQADFHNTKLVLDDRTHEPIMTHRPSLTSILTVFTNTLMDLNEDNEKNQITMRGYKTRDGKLGIGIFGDVQLTQTDLRRSLELQGRAHMPLAASSNRAHVSLSIAYSLCKAIGGSMRVKHMGKLSGFATELPRSEQLAFV